MKITLLAIGRLKSRPVKELVADYSERLRHYLAFDVHECRDEKDACAYIKPGDFLVVLDERGAEKSSKELASFIAKHQLRGTKHMVFFIGGENGAGEAIRKKANYALGLSRLTFPHELAQALFTEQLYRACSIIKGEPYHRA